MIMASKTVLEEATDYLQNLPADALHRDVAAVQLLVQCPNLRDLTMHHLEQALAVLRAGGKPMWETEKRSNK